MEVFKWDQPYHDLTPRYVPDTVMTLHGMQPVTGTRFYPVGTHPASCPIRADMGVLEMRVPFGSSCWHGCQRAYINAELRMVIVGIDVRNEVIRKWPVVPEALR